MTEGVTAKHRIPIGWHNFPNSQWQKESLQNIAFLLVGTIFPTSQWQGGTAKQHISLGRAQFFRLANDRRRHRWTAHSNWLAQVIQLANYRRSHCKTAHFYWLAQFFPISQWQKEAPQNGASSIGTIFLTSQRQKEALQNIAFLMVGTIFPTSQWQRRHRQTAHFSW